MDTETNVIMSEKVDTTNEQVTKPNNWGLRLKIAREAMNLTQQEAATRLYLNPKIIIKIENEDLVHSAPAIFMRGYIRSYARLLNIPVKEIDQAIAELGLATPQPNTIENLALQAHPQGLENSHRYVRWITYPVIAILITLVFIWWNGHTRYHISDIDNTKTPAQPVQSAANSNQIVTLPTGDAPPAAENIANTIVSPSTTTSHPPQANIVTAERQNKPTIPHPSITNMDMDIPEPGLETD